MKKESHAGRRAIIWMAWGKKHVTAASQSRASAVDIHPYPTFLITDAQSAELAEANDFDVVIAADFCLDGHLRKAELWKWLPSDFDTFLFLDTDTRVLLDVGLGFKKAEQFGMAIAPAPHFSLDYFWGYNQTMIDAGLSPSGQLLYNSGVFFFNRTPPVASVFEKWEALAEKYGGPMDQPHLSLAMELLGFNPYTLTPAYNYRVHHGPISGVVRIWHSPRPVPNDLNEEPAVWPLRRVVDGHVVSKGKHLRRARQKVKHLLRKYNLLEEVKKFRSYWNSLF